MSIVHYVVNNLELYVTKFLEKSRSPMQAIPRQMNYLIWSRQTANFLPFFRGQAEVLLQIQMCQVNHHSPAGYSLYQRAGRAVCRRTLIYFRKNQLVNLSDFNWEMLGTVITTADSDKYIGMATSSINTVVSKWASLHCFSV